MQLIELAGDNLREFQPEQPLPEQPLPIATTGYLLLAGIYLDQNKLEKMAQLVERAFRLCRKSGGAKILVETHVMQSRLHQAQGDIDSAYRSIDSAERVYILKESMTRFRLESQKARLNVETGAYEDVIVWMKALKTADEGIFSPAVVPTLLYEVAQLILARLYLEKHEPQKALHVLEAIESSASDEGRYRHVLESLTLRALAFQELNQNQEALESLEQAIRLAEVEGFVRVFFDKGDPMQRLLYKSVDIGVMPTFTKKLLAEFPQATKTVQKPSPLAIEPLSNREIEVLEHLTRGLSYRQIAQKMVISLNTVKTHTGNIYSKLGVNNRTQAGIKAKALGLIE
jgi:LuxR family maltose regulon positive regulatory protein